MFLIEQGRSIMMTGSFILMTSALRRCIMTRQLWFTRLPVRYLLLVLTPMLLFAIPYLRRFVGYGTEHYLLLRLAEHPGFYDALSFGGRAAIYPWIMTLLVKYLEMYLPIILGFLAIVLFSLLIRKHLVGSHNFA